LKQGAVRRYTNWEGKKVWTVSAKDVEYVIFKHWPKLPRNKPPLFKLAPKQYTNATVKYPLTTDHIQNVTNIRILQVPVISNVAITGHKLQGMSKDTLIMHSWNYSTVNWVYVVLSRVRTLSGLYLCTPIDLDRQFKVPEALLAFESNMKRREEAFLIRREQSIAEINGSFRLH